MQPNVDLHTHSTFSDGFLTPTELVHRARANGVDILALTDHDEVAGLAEAHSAAWGHPMQLINGVEISVSWADETVHVVGLNIDPNSSDLAEGLQGIRLGRDTRAEKMSQALAEAGFEDVLSGAMRFARNRALLSRAHFARELVSRGAMPDVSSVFRHYLVPGKPGFVPHEWASLDQALAWIHTAGGLAVLAHPGRYYRLSSEELEHLFEAFTERGGVAVEVVSGAHDAHTVNRMAHLARRYGLLASRASDFHGEHESPVDVGRSQALPPDLVPVWTRF